jgi:hypothetical protein
MKCFHCLSTAAAKQGPAVAHYADAVAESRHDVATPTTTPPPTPSPQPPTATIPTTTPAPSPPLIKEEAIQAQAREREGEMKSKSPQPWGNPDSPGPELNPAFEEPEDEALMQPKPVWVEK